MSKFRTFKQGSDTYAGEIMPSGRHTSIAGASAMSDWSGHEETRGKDPKYRVSDTGRFQGGSDIHEPGNRARLIPMIKLPYVSIQHNKEYDHD
jgi:hypothetical protein